ncbi:MAG: hypothetical protein ACUVTP_08255 [Candidatus Fervidibacter sp.]|uniref:hypothetical protein n=1 Tax=Candidatus Fervidibacter sp. TaxID=3100871 RepID=UPI00404ACED9
MWGTLFKQASRLAQEGYSRKEVQEILKRAAELQAQSELREERKKQDQINRDALRAGALAAGIQPKFLEQALREFHERKGQQVQGRSSVGKNWGKLAVLVPALIFALPIAFFVFATLAFAFGLTFSALLIAGVALATVGLALFAVSSFFGIGMIIGLAVVVGSIFDRHRKRWKKGKRRWKFRLDEDD